MSNTSAPLIITLPVGESVVQNLTDNIEMRWLQLILNTIQQSNMPNNYYNVAILLFVVCLIAMLVLRFIKKQRHYFSCSKKKSSHSNMLQQREII